MRKLLALIALFLPGVFKRVLYNRVFGYSIHPAARIGFSYIACRQLAMDENSRIGHLNVLKGLRSVELGESASIGNLNWITGFPLGTKSAHFRHETDRDPCLILGRHAAITHRHLIDCTNRVSIGQFSTMAGFRSQILTHSISIEHCAQQSAPVRIGDYCFVGTAVTVLPGSALPAYSVLGAGALLNKAHSQEYCLYSGVPAMPTKDLGKNSRYFHRATGYVI